MKQLVFGLADPRLPVQVFTEGRIEIGVGYTPLSLLMNW